LIRQLQEIAKIFSNVAHEEEKWLFNKLEEGIFFMPELAFAYACGKAVMGKKTEIFGQTKVKWIREQRIGESGPSDLIFDLPDDDVKIVVEFKMRSRSDRYLADIKKLTNLKSSKNVLIFCALVDRLTADNKPDPRIVNLVQLAGSESITLRPLIEPFPEFPTKQHWCVGDTNCVVGVWHVEESSTIPNRPG
jgi:hypothetical protein